MNGKFEKIFNHWTMLGLNVLIIFIVEFTGTLFADTGLIHLIAIIFIILGASRIFVHHDVYDQYLKPFIHGGIFALITFAASHVIEYTSHMYLNLPYDVISTNVINLYLASLLIITLGIEYFLRKIDKRSNILIPIILIGIISAFSALATSLSGREISLDPDKPLMYIYTLAIIIVTVFGIARLLRIKKHVSILVNFINYFVAGYLLIGFSSLQYVLYEVFLSLGIPLFRIVYTSHFLFYGALSLMFLAFVRLAQLGGIYTEIEKSNH